MKNYLDDINRLNDYVEKNFTRPNDVIFHCNTVEEIREVNSRYWGAREALLKCSENPLKDPLDILDDLEQEFERISLFDSKQKINKEHFNRASRAVHEMYDFLLEERS